MSIRRITQILIALIVLSVVAIIITLYWASSPNYSEEQYVQLIEDQFPTSTNNDSIFSIITYNIGYLSGMTNNKAVESNKSLFDDNLDHVKDQLKTVNPDIICLQEIDFYSSRSFHINQQEELRQLGYNYTFQAVNWDENYLPFPGTNIAYHYGEIYSGQSILSKYPISDPERIVLERVEDTPFYRDAFYLDRLAQVCNISVNGIEIIVINVHLEAYDKETRRKQTEYVAGLYNKYKDVKPVLLVGDFNSDSNYSNATINTLMEIQGIAYVPSDSADMHYTYPSPAPRVRIDYVFYNDAFIEMESAEVLSSFGQASDHLPVMMTFKLR